MMQLSKEERIERLTQQWKHAKEQEATWNAQRISFESEIYEIVQNDLPEKGTYTLGSGMKIPTGYSEDWDQGQLGSAYNQWPVESVKFPFASVYKPDVKAIAVIRDSIPDLYRVIQHALTIKPKKPAFSIKD